MKAATVVMFISAMLSACVYAQAARGDSGERAADAAEIRKLVSEVSEAYETRDYELIERVYLPDFVYVKSKPQYNYRTQLIAMLKADARDLAAGKKLDYQTLSYTAENPQIRFFGNTAIVNVAKKYNWSYRGDKCLTRYQSTEVWIKREGSWHAAATQITTFQCDLPPFYPGHEVFDAIPTQTVPLANSDIGAEVAVRTFIDQLTAKLGASPAGGFDQVFADDYISTNLDGSVTVERAPFLAMLQLRLTGSPRFSRRDEAVRIFGDTAIFLFRVKPRSEAPKTIVPIQVSAVLVNFGGRWQIVATHMNKVDD